MNEQTDAIQNAAVEESYISRTSGLKNRDYVGYAFGDVACCLVFGLVTSLLQKFYTDIFHLSPLFIMIMMVGARVWDAINDPIMGRIADTIKPSKYGRYRPWFLWAAIPLVLSSILQFVKWPGLGGEFNYVGTAVYATITYIMFGMSYTALQIPYGSLASVVTTNEKERSKLSIFRSVGAGLGSIPAVLISVLCFKDVLVNGEEVSRMQFKPMIIGVVIVSLIAFGVLYAAFKMNRERVPAAPAAKRGKGETARIIKKLLKSRSFLSVSCASMMLLAGQMFMQSFYLYLFNDYFGYSWMNIVATVCTYAPMVVLMFVTPKLVRKFGKKEICAVGAAIAACANLLMFACRGLMPQAWWLYLILTFVSGFGITFLILQVWSMATDAIDDIEVNTSSRDDGMAYAMFMFFRKLGQVIAAVAVNGALLGMSYGFEVDAAPATGAQLSLMYDLGTIIPAVLFGVMALILFLWYPLSKKRVADLQVQKEQILRLHFEAAGIAEERTVSVKAEVDEAVETDIAEADVDETVETGEPSGEDFDLPESNE